ncbi:MULTISPECIES: acyltransferase [Sphingobacterium]|uniref:acyltransferase n=1 Tax=Sphingobacterium TaxID=28453 RepID=UPI00257D296A|nr:MULTISPECIES: acyltransferase [Sphingobacterium]
MIYKIFWFLRGLLYSFFFGKFGLYSYLGKPIFIHNIHQIYIGNRVRIFPNNRMEVHGKNSRIIIQDNVGIAQNVHITSGGDLIIGKGSTILANVFITNIDHEYNVIDKPILEQGMSIRETSIGENCFIGIGAAIQAGTILGKHCIVGANSVVRGIFPDYCVIVGAPARIVKKYNFTSKIWEKV